MRSSEELAIIRSNFRSASDPRPRIVFISSNGKSETTLTVGRFHYTSQNLAATRASRAPIDDPTQMGSLKPYEVSEKSYVPRSSTTSFTLRPERLRLRGEFAVRSQPCPRRLGDPARGRALKVERQQGSPRRAAEKGRYYRLHLVERRQERV
jgi:hypothetical protein